MTVTPTADSPDANVTVNGNVVVSGSPSGVISLNVGSDTNISIVVTSPDGLSQNIYTITVNGLANDASLSALAISSGSLLPAFAPGSLFYSDSVPNSVTSVTVTPSANQPDTTIEVNGNAVASGTASGAISLNVGSNPITTVVTAQDGSTQDTYIIYVTRAPSSDATLSNLTVSAGTLTPVFASGTTTYTDNVANTVTSVTVTPSANQANATIKVNGAVVTSGLASGAITLNIGSTTITIAVTAQDGVTQDTYTVIVKNTASQTWYLNSIAGAASGYDQMIRGDSSGVTSNLLSQGLLLNIGLQMKLLHLMLPLHQVDGH